ncbi:MAG TPA: hypothetical protein VGL31_17230 [Xanthobacteraceae bacterium]|jgi:hypothetical protein
MLTDSLPTNATSSRELNSERLPEALEPVAPDRRARNSSDERALSGINTPRKEWRRMLDEIVCSRMTRASTSHVARARPTHGKPQLVRKPSDWTASSRPSIVLHGPTKTVFEISARPDLSPDDILTLEDFRARLVHAGENRAPATDADLQELRGEAVVMALFLLGLAWPATVNADR